MGGYTYATLSPAGDRDIYRVRVPEAGRYTFETHGLFGFCGWGLEVDTIMDVYNAGGQLLITQDDFDAARDRYCSRVTLELGPGVYFVHVRGFGSATGQYGVSVREG